MRKQGASVATTMMIDPTSSRSCLHSMALSSTKREQESFWLHKMSACQTLETTFEVEQDKSLAEFLRSVGATG